MVPFLDVTTPLSSLDGSNTKAMSVPGISRSNTGCATGVPDSSSQLKNRIQELHDNYLSQKMCNENDTAYMRQMVSEILNCYEEIFTNKREFARFMGWVRRKAGAKTA